MNRQLKARPSIPVPEKMIEKVEVPVLTKDQMRALEAASSEMNLVAEQISRSLVAWIKRPQTIVPPSVTVNIPPPARKLDAGFMDGVKHAFEGSLPKAERRILTALAQYPNGRNKAQLAILAGYAINGGGFNNSIGALRTKGFLQGSRDQFSCTPVGMEALGGAWEPLPEPGKELVDYWMRALTRAERSVLDYLFAMYPSGTTKEDLAAATGYTADGGGFNNALGRLRTLELIKGRGQLTLNPDLVEG